MGLVTDIAARLRALGQPTGDKVFGIGLNKTGTKSLEVAYLRLGLRIGPQAEFERLFDDFIQGRHARFFRIIRQYEAFQDVPFCLPGAYRTLYAQYPTAKYVLTVRASADDWIQSITRFHLKLFGGEDGRPTRKHLAQASYISPGWALRVMTAGYGTPDGQDPYDPQWLRQRYESHLADATHFFSEHKGNLLVLDVSAPDAHLRLAEFLGREGKLKEFPHKNRT